MNCDTFSTLLSIISLAVTIVLGVGAILQSRKYNKEAEKINEDTKYILVQQIRLLNELNKGLGVRGSKNGSLDLSKDEIRFHKLSMFNKSDIGEIKQEISHLKIKRKILNNVEKYLDSNELDYQCSFWERQMLMKKLALKSYIQYC